ncbi:MAG: NAD(P)/FAD-dependent oxidoreductase [Dehalococcoidia bacterium]
MDNHTNTVIIGGGIAGCATAYFLGKKGIPSIIVENEGIASGASGYSAGGLNPLVGHGIPGPLGPLAMYSYEKHLSIWPELEQETGINFDGRIIDLLRIGLFDSDIEQLSGTLNTFNAIDHPNFKAELLEPQDVISQYPLISSNVKSAVLATGNAACDSYKLTLAFANAAEKLGALFKSDEVIGLNTKGEKVIGVKTRNGTIHCDSVVVAMGPWSLNASKWIGMDIPVTPLKGQIIRLKYPLIQQYPDVEVPSLPEASIHPKLDGLIWCGATKMEELDEPFSSKAPTDRARDTIMDKIVQIIPSLINSELILQTVCFRPVTEDWLPILGSVPHLENCYLATGGGEKGVMLSSAIGEAIADLIGTGVTSVPIGNASVDRIPVSTGNTA